jgi:uncharacterized OsmC-like protein
MSHGPSGTVVETDAPTDNGGAGSAFSPSDLLGAALASCILTTMAIVAKRDGIAFEGARAEVTKEMSEDSPRRIATLGVTLHLPALIPAEYRPKLERVASRCPVHNSLHPDIKIPVEFHWQ